jgi:hypothetical protein
MEPLRRTDFRAYVAECISEAPNGFRRRGRLGVIGGSYPLDALLDALLPSLCNSSG